ncbi:unnamed protein product [Lampetra planeri]
MALDVWAVAREALCGPQVETARLVGRRRPDVCGLSVRAYESIVASGQALMSHDTFHNAARRELGVGDYRRKKLYPRWNASCGRSYLQPPVQQAASRDQASVFVHG